MGSIPGTGKSSGEENDNLLQYSCLENPLGGGAWQAPVQKGRKESDMTKHAGKAERSGGVLAPARVAQMWVEIGIQGASVWGICH